MKIVLNKCFGGFGISKEAVKYLESKNQIKIYNLFEDIKDDKELWALTDNIEIFTNAEDFRTDQRIIDVVEKLGDKANGFYSSLEIVEIPDGIEYEIHEYDGVETVHEKHRSW